MGSSLAARVGEGRGRGHTHGHAHAKVQETHELTELTNLTKKQTVEITMRKGQNDNYDELRTQMSNSTYG